VPALINRVALWALACLLPCVALAQAPQLPMRWPTSQDIDRALKANPFPGADRIDAQPIAQPPRVNPQRSAIDIEAIARSKFQLPNAGATTGTPPVPLRIFITLDMPRASLQLLTDQASRAGAVLVLRGLKSQSMRQTVAIVNETVGRVFGRLQVPNFQIAPCNSHSYEFLRKKCEGYLERRQSGLSKRKLYKIK
jgi:conjugal transfer pilus assembly protein TrbC